MRTSAAGLLLILAAAVATAGCADGQPEAGDDGAASAQASGARDDGQANDPGPTALGFPWPCPGVGMDSAIAEVQVASAPDTIRFGEHRLEIPRQALNGARDIGVIVYPDSLRFKVFVERQGPDDFGQAAPRLVVSLEKCGALEGQGPLGVRTPGGGTKADIRPVVLVVLDKGDVGWVDDVHAAMAEEPMPPGPGPRPGGFIVIGN